ncbi:hypothetical protein [Anaerobacillus arseniciselenatis]|nr:hypothetical protein [Anaerobacillus arseniciselenatis]
MVSWKVGKLVSWLVSWKVESWKGSPGHGEEKGIVHLFHIR